MTTSLRTYWTDGATKTQPGTILALSIAQPWTFLLAHGFQDIENRDWATLYRGPLLLHASQGIDSEILNRLSGQYIYNQLPEHWKAAWEQLPADQDYETGGFVGIAKLVDCVTESASPWFSGKFGFVLQDAVPIPLIPYRGQLGLFPVQYGKLRIMTPKGPGRIMDYGTTLWEQVHRDGLSVFVDDFPGVHYFQVKDIRGIPPVERDRS